MALAVSAALLFIIDSIESSKMLMGARVPFLTVAGLFWAKLKIMIFQIAPLGLLLAVVVTIGGLELRSELIAAQAGGINPARFVVHAAVFSTLVAAGMFVMEEEVVPEASKAVDEITTVKLGKFTSTWTYFYRERDWFRGASGSLFKVGHVDQARGVLEDVIMLELDDSGLIKRRVEAVTATYDGGTWDFRNAVIMDFPGSTSMKRSRSDSLKLIIPERISDFRVMKGRPQQMRYSELGELIDYRKGRGIEAKRYLFERDAKISYPLSAIFVALAGAMSIFLFKGGVSIIRYVVYATGVCFLYWTFYSLGASASESGLIPPLVCAWLPNAALAVLTAYLFFRKGLKGA
jgi:lipopolysaccharide export system permease protein